MPGSVSISFDIRAVMDGGFPAVFKNAGRVMQDLQNKTSTLSKTIGQVSNYRKLEERIKADQAAVQGISPKSLELNQRMQTIAAQTALLRTQFRGADAEALKMRGSLEFSKSSYGAAAEKVAELNRQMKASPSPELRQKLSAAQAEAANLKNAVAQNAEKFKTASAKAKDLNKQLKQSESQEKNLARESSNLAYKTSELENKIARKKSALNELSPALVKAGIDTKNLASEQERLIKESEKAAAAQEKIQKARAEYAAVKERLSWGNLKGDLLTSAGMIMSLKAPVMTAANFEQAMARVNAVSFGGISDVDKTSEQRAQFEALKKQAAELGQLTQYTAVQAASAQEMLARAGFKPLEITKAMPGLLNMAAAEGMELSAAADIAASSLRGFNLDAGESERVADVLAKTSAMTNTSISGLGESMKYVAPIAQGLGISIEQTSAMLGAMANAGIKGSQGGTALRAAFTRLTKQPKEVQKALNALKIPVFDKKGRLREMPGLMQEIAKATEKMGEGQKMALLEKIFGTEAASGMLAVMNSAVKGELKEYEEALEHAKDTSKNMADVVNDTLEGDLTKLSSAWEGLNNAIGEEFLPLARGAVQAFADLVNSVTRLTKEFPALTKVAVMGFGAIALAKISATGYRITKDVLSIPALLKNMSGAGAAAGGGAAAGAGGAAMTGAGGAGGAAVTGAAGSGGAAAAGGGAVSSVMSMIPPVLMAVGGVMTVLEMDKNYLKKNEDLIDKWVKIAAEKNVNIDAQAIASSLSYIEAFAAGKQTREQSAWNMQSNSVRELLNAYTGYKQPPVIPPQEVLKNSKEIINNSDINNKKEILNTETLNKVNEVSERLNSVDETVKILPAAEAVVPVISELNAQSKLGVLRDEAAQWSGQLIEGMRGAGQAVYELPERLKTVFEIMRENQPPIVVQAVAAPVNNIMNSRFVSGGGFAAHAAGGIFSAPHFGLVAEAGTEAIIPLENKARGIPLWLAAGEEMGLSFGSALTSINNNTSSPEYNINITIESNGGGVDYETEGRLKRAVLEVIREIREREMMVSFQ